MKTSFFFVFFLFSILHFVAQKRDTLLLPPDSRINIQVIPSLKSDFRETNLSMSEDGKKMYFMSLRGMQVWSNSFMTYKGDSVSE